MQKQVDIQNKKIAKLEKKLVEFELNEDKLKSQLAVKDDTILSLQENVKSLKKEYTSGWDSQKGNIENITSLEAQLRYKEIEVQELGQEISSLRLKKNNEINELQEQVKEYTDLYNQARGAQMELQVFKLRQVDIDKLREKNKQLSEQNEKLKD